MAPTQQTLDLHGYFLLHTAPLRMTPPNPYAPVKLQAGEAVSKTVATPSTWLRNFKALAVVVVCYSLICVLFALARVAMPEVLFPALLVLAFVASAWANVPLGPQIGWDRGGLPIVFVLFFLAVTGYCVSALLAGGLASGMINPVTIYTPYGY
jgi:hypothetical protein